MTIRNEKLNALLNLGTARFLNVENHFITIKRFDFFYSFLRLGFNFVFQNKEETWQLLKLLSLIIKLNKPEVVKTTLNAAEFDNLIIFSVTIFHNLGKIPGNTMEASVCSLITLFPDREWFQRLGWSHLVNLSYSLQLPQIPISTSGNANQVNDESTHPKS